MYSLINTQMKLVLLLSLCRFIHQGSNEYLFEFFLIFFLRLGFIVLGLYNFGYSQSVEIISQSNHSFNSDNNHFAHHRCTRNYSFQMKSAHYLSIYCYVSIDRMSWGLLRALYSKQMGGWHLRMTLGQEGREHSHGKSQYNPGKQVLVRSRLWKKSI